MRKPQHTPQLPEREQADIDRRRAHGDSQPYATELDGRELESAHKEQRPVEPTDKSRRPAKR